MKAYSWNFGSFLLCCNCQQCIRRTAALQVPLYTAEIVERYVNRGTPRDGSESPEPHVFLTADSAYKAMARNNASQSLVITGESGSGKTETTKIAMQVHIPLPCQLLLVGPSTMM